MNQHFTHVHKLVLIAFQWFHIDKIISIYLITKYPSLEVEEGGEGGGGLLAHRLGCRGSRGSSDDDHSKEIQLYKACIFHRVKF